MTLTQFTVYLFILGFYCKVLIIYSINVIVTEYITHVKHQRPPLYIKYD